MSDRSTQNAPSSKKKSRKNPKRQNRKPYPVEAMRKRMVYLLRRHLSGMPEGRRDGEGRLRYLIADFAIAVIITIVRGCPSHVYAVVEFWKGNAGLLHSLGLSVNGEAEGCVPSLASYCRLSGVPDSGVFRDRLFAFIPKISMTGIRRGLGVLAVDGKTMRGTSCGKSGKPVHILTAFLQALSIPIDCNGITAWKKLLELPGNKCDGMVFTSDAM